MAKVLIVYGSTTGNTEWVASAVESQIKESGHEVAVLNASKAKADGLCSGQDMVLFGCSTWGQDEIELQDDFIPLFEAFDKIEAKDTKMAVFGCGDDDYTYYCGAVDAIADKLTELGGQLIGDKLKINGDPGDSSDAIKSWTGKVIAAL